MRGALAAEEWERSWGWSLNVNLGVSPYGWRALRRLAAVPCDGAEEEQRPLINEALCAANDQQASGNRSPPTPPRQHKLFHAAQAHAGADDGGG